MTTPFEDSNINAITELLAEYFDGLYDGDIEKFSKVFHPASHLYETDGETVTDMARADYFAKIEARESPRAQNLARFDRIVSIHQSGPNTAFAIVNCAIPPRYFTDYLTLMKTADGWQIISKSYHVDQH